MLTATYLNGATATVDHGIGDVTNGIPVSTGSLSVTTTYSLTIRSAEGNTTTALVTVSVVDVAAALAMGIDRHFHTATLLPSGKVLLRSHFLGKRATDRAIGRPAARWIHLAGRWLQRSLIVHLRAVETSHRAL